MVIIEHMTSATMPTNTDSSVNAVSSVNNQTQNNKDMIEFQNQNQISLLNSTELGNDTHATLSSTTRTEHTLSTSNSKGITVNQENYPNPELEEQFKTEVFKLLEGVI